ncbi:class I SAM-dependent methyltransferase [Anoxynatronum buryatiense]|uniref:Methyltransferase domain-containing protein n=1 Tax=Anoxynatronum buryatiense TaxID=489973 RepID=A0AA45WTT8_9CLOT|nr:class I SAM-dependent methyltransferase [Anoxynatronum buryatiense]SMP44647.1 Methyltransferase domain-containing protein [Anoxynatronum buryatiense]
MTFFNSVANEYDQWYTTPMGSLVDRVETDLAMKLFPLQPGMQVLDAGCGTGNFSLKLAQQGVAVTGIDVSTEMLAFAREKAKVADFEIPFVEMDMYQLDYSDQTFDGVFSMAAFEFIREPERALKELFRVLKPGGFLLVGTINRESAWGELYTSPDFQKNTVFKHASFKSLDDMKAWEPNQLVKTGSCLFLPPDTPDDQWTLEQEDQFRQHNRGGFICALWQKR